MILTRIFPTADAVSIDLIERDARDRLAALYDPGLRKWLRLNLVASVSGSAAGTDGTSETLTNRADRALLGVIRRQSDVVLVGAASVRAEGYQLPRHALLVILTRSGDLGSDRFSDQSGAGRVMVFCPAAAEPVVRASVGTLEVEIVTLPDEDGRLDVTSVVAVLAGRGLTRIVCEGGPSLAAQLLDADLVDELCLSTSARVTGGTLPLFGAGALIERPLRLAQLLVDDASGLYARWMVRGRTSPEDAQAIL